MSLFIGALAFPGRPVLVEEAKIGILLGSLAVRARRLPPAALRRRPRTRPGPRSQEPTRKRLTSLQKRASSTRVKAGKAADGALHRAARLSSGDLCAELSVCDGFACLAVSASALAQPCATAPAPKPLPAPTGEPMTIDFAADPVLRLRRQQADFEPFRDVVAAAVERHPGTPKSAAGEDEALAALEEARAGAAADGRPQRHLLPRPLPRLLRRSVQHHRAVAARAAHRRHRLSVTQTLFDFGATTQRILAAGARLRAAGADLEARGRPGRAERGRRLVRRLRLSRPGRADRGLRRQPARPARRGRDPHPRGRLGRGRPRPGRFLHRPGRDPARPLPPPARQRRGALHRADRHAAAGRARARAGRRARPWRAATRPRSPPAKPPRCAAPRRSPTPAGREARAARADRLPHAQRRRRCRPLRRVRERPRL